MIVEQKFGGGATVELYASELPDEIADKLFRVITRVSVRRPSLQSGARDLFIFFPIRKTPTRSASMMLTGGIMRESAMIDRAFFSLPAATEVVIILVLLYLQDILSPFFLSDANETSLFFCA